MATHPGLDHVGFASRNAAQTGFFGRKLGEAAIAGDLILLEGPFGAGKTTLVKGIALGLGIQQHVTSPSFTLVNEYHQGRLPLYHVDLFRLTELDLEMELAIESCEEGEGLTVIEWPELLPADLRQGGLRTEMEILGDDERGLMVHAEGSRWRGEELLAMMEAALRFHGQEER